MLQALIADYKKADLDDQDLIMLAYVEKLTIDPEHISSKDILSLRRTGFDDRAIHDICTIAAYFNFVNRIADGLGVDLEERFKGNEKET